MLDFLHFDYTLSNLIFTGITVFSQITKVLFVVYDTYSYYYSTKIYVNLLSCCYQFWIQAIHFWIFECCLFQHPGMREHTDYLQFDLNNYFVLLERCLSTESVIYPIPAELEVFNHIRIPSSWIFDVFFSDWSSFLTATQIQESRFLNRFYFLPSNPDFECFDLVWEEPTLLELWQSQKKISNLRNLYYSNIKLLNRPEFTFDERKLLGSSLSNIEALTTTVEQFQLDLFKKKFLLVQFSIFTTIMIKLAYMFSLYSTYFSCFIEFLYSASQASRSLVLLQSTKFIDESLFYYYANTCSYSFLSAFFFLLQSLVSVLFLISNCVLVQFFIFIHFFFLKSFILLGYGLLFFFISSYVHVGFSIEFLFSFLLLVFALLASMPRASPRVSLRLIFFTQSFEKALFWFRLGRKPLLLLGAILSWWIAGTFVCSTQFEQEMFIRCLDFSYLLKLGFSDLSLQIYVAYCQLFFFIYLLLPFFFWGAYLRYWISPHIHKKAFLSLNSRDLQRNRHIGLLALIDPCNILLYYKTTFVYFPWQLNFKFCHSVPDSDIIRFGWLKEGTISFHRKTYFWIRAFMPYTFELPLVTFQASLPWLSIKKIPFTFVFPFLKRDLLIYNPFRKKPISWSFSYRLYWTLSRRVFFSFFFGMFIFLNFVIVENFASWICFGFFFFSCLSFRLLKFYILPLKDFWYFDFKLYISKLSESLSAFKQWYYHLIVLVETYNWRTVISYASHYLREKRSLSYRQKYRSYYNLFFDENYPLDVQETTELFHWLNRPKYARVCIQKPLWFTNTRYVVDFTGEMCGNGLSGKYYPTILSMNMQGQYFMNEIFEDRLNRAGEWVMQVESLLDGVTATFGQSDYGYYELIMEYDLEFMMGYRSHISRFLDQMMLGVVSVSEQKAIREKGVDYSNVYKETNIRLQQLLDEYALELTFQLNVLVYWYAENLFQAVVVRFLYIFTIICCYLWYNIIAVVQLILALGYGVITYAFIWYIAWFIFFFLFLVFWKWVFYDSLILYGFVHFISFRVWNFVYQWLVIFETFLSPVLILYYELRKSTKQILEENKLLPQEKISLKSARILWVEASWQYQLKIRIFSSFRNFFFSLRCMLLAIGSKWHLSRGKKLKTNSPFLRFFDLFLSWFRAGCKWYSRLKSRLRL